MQLMNSLLIELDKKSMKLRYGIEHWKVLTENWFINHFIFLPIRAYIISPMFSCLVLRSDF
jgi:hypothetical protein